MIHQGRRRILIAAIVLLAAVVASSAAWGRYPEPGFLGAAEIRSDPLARALIWNIRIPRILTALMLGASLAGAGHVLQTVLGNPLVEPGLLGVSQGSAFGAALAILMAGGVSWAVPLFASAFGLGGLGLSWVLARRFRYGGSILRLVLAGIVVSAFFSSGLGILKSLADPRSELPEITFWLMGGLSSADWPAVIRTAGPVFVCLVFLVLHRWRINLLSLDDRSAFGLGGRPGRERGVLVIVSVVAVAAVTAVAGVVSWVGLLVPHASRRIAGADTARSLPLSMALGALFVLLCDDLARGLLAGEIPLGLITALIGALLFAILMTLGERRIHGR